LPIGFYLVRKPLIYKGLRDQINLPLTKLSGVNRAILVVI